MNHVAYCNDTLTPPPECTGIGEQSVVWSTTYVVAAPGPERDAVTGAWTVPATFEWTVADRMSTGDNATAFETLSRLWATHVGPWDQAEGVSQPAGAPLDFRTVDPFTDVTPALGYPFADPDLFDALAARMEARAVALDPAAHVDVQPLHRFVEVGFIDPMDTSMLHVVRVYYHALGFVCAVSENVGPWLSGGPRGPTGFRNGLVLYKTDINRPRLTRPGRQPVYCKCDPTTAGSDCT